MIPLPEAWRTGGMRPVLRAVAWLLIALGLYGGYGEACGTEGWGSFILTGFGVLVLALLAVGAAGLSPKVRAARLAAAVLALPLALVLQSMFQEFVRFACPG